MPVHPIDRLTLGEPKCAANLAVFPLFLSPTKGPDYRTLAEALDDGGLRVTEISDSGSVPQLQVDNPSDHRVLLLDGEELRGAKQNRIVNTTLLLAPRSLTRIPVSCTEQGRWRYTTPTFSAGKTVMPSKSRRRKTRSVTNTLSVSADHLHFMPKQGMVWSDVEEVNTKWQSHSSTGALAAAFEKAREQLEAVLQALPAEPHQNGLMVFINSEPAGLDLLSQPEAYVSLHPQLLQSYAMEALTLFNEDPQKASPAAAPDILTAKALLERFAAIPGKPYPSVGLGTDWRFLNGELVGSGLEFQDTWIHLAAFIDPEEDTGSHAVPPARRNPLASLYRRTRYRRPGPDAG